MAMRSMTRELVEIDQHLTKLQRQLHDHTWEPDEIAALRVDIDTWLERRHSITTGTARRSHA
jgi:hypothetical protein